MAEDGADSIVAKVAISTMNAAASGLYLAPIVAIRLVLSNTCSSSSSRGPNNAPTDYSDALRSLPGMMVDAVESIHGLEAHPYLPDGDDLRGRPVSPNGGLVTCDGF